MRRFARHKWRSSATSRTIPTIGKRYGGGCVSACPNLVVGSEWAGLGLALVEVITKLVKTLITAVWWEWTHAGDGVEGAEGAAVRANNPHDEELLETVHLSGPSELQGPNSSAGVFGILLGRADVAGVWIPRILAAQYAAFHASNGQVYNMDTAIIFFGGMHWIGLIDIQLIWIGLD